VASMLVGPSYKRRLTIFSKPENAPPAINNIFVVSIWTQSYLSSEL
jgi:hypothetical protein